LAERRAAEQKQKTRETFALKTTEFIVTAISGPPVVLISDQNDTEVGAHLMSDNSFGRVSVESQR